MMCLSLINFLLHQVLHIIRFMLGLSYDPYILYINVPLIILNSAFMLPKGHRGYQPLSSAGSYLVGIIVLRLHVSDTPHPITHKSHRTT